MKTVIGIDFGTSTTVVAKRRENSRFEPEIIEIDGKQTTDTVIRLSKDGRQIEAIGPDAWAAAEQYPKTTFFEFKPQIGTDTSYELTTGKQLTPEHVAVLFLQRVREAIERFYGDSELKDRETVTVIGYPAEWPEERKSRIVELAKRAGFPNPEGCAEPLAVLYYHHNQGDLDLDKPQKILVYDLGGGTTDSCIVQVQSLNKSPKILATGGADIGGRHFDESLAHVVEKTICKDEAVDTLAPEDKITVRKTGRLLKERLSDEARYGRTQFKYSVPPLFTTGRTFKLRMTIPHFEAACGKLVEQLNAPIDSVLSRSALSEDQVHRVVIAGGMGRLYSVRTTVEERFKHLKKAGITTSTNPQEVVAKGLVLYGLRDEIASQESERESTAKQQRALAEQTKIQQRNAARKVHGNRSARRLPAIFVVVVLALVGAYFALSRSPAEVPANKDAHNNGEKEAVPSTESLSPAWQDYWFLAGQLPQWSELIPDCERVDVGKERPLHEMRAVLESRAFDLTEHNFTDRECADIALKFKSFLQQTTNVFANSDTLEEIDDQTTVALKRESAALALRMASIAERLAPKENNAGVFAVDFYETWMLDDISKVILVNETKQRFENVTVKVVLGGNNGDSENLVEQEMSHVFFVDVWEPGETRCAVFTDMPESNYFEAPTNVEEVEASIWSPSISQEGTLFKYTEEEKNKDAEARLKNLELHLTYQPYQDNWTFDTQRRLTLTFDGAPTLLFPKVMVGFVNGEQKQSKELELETWVPGERLMFESEPDGQYWKFDPKQIHVKITWPHRSYVWKKGYAPSDWVVESEE